MFELNNILDIWNRKPDKLKYILYYNLPKEFINQINKINDSIQKQYNKTIEHIKTFKKMKLSEILIIK